MSVVEAQAPERPLPEAKRALLAKLSAQFGNRFSTGSALREQHANTMTWIKCEPPDAVVFAESTQEVIEVVRLCAEARVPVIPFGTGTSLEGQVNAPFGGVSLDLSRMNRILAVHAEDLDCVVEPGVTRKALNDHLRDLGLFFPIDPGADASLGGMAATRASGTNAVRYGTMRDNVLSLSAVMADGALLKTGNRARKSSSGYDLTRLLVGSEGTLGIITELTLKLHGIPETDPRRRLSLRHHRRRLQRHHRRDADRPAARPHRAARRGADQGLQRLFASHAWRAADAVPRVSRHGGEHAEQVENFAEIARSEGGGDFRWAECPEERTKLWQARHDAYWAARGLRPGADVVTTDVCVPIIALAACVGETMPISRARACSPPSSAMWATAISTSCRSSMPAALRNGVRCRASSTGWSTGHCAWMAPAQVSMASAKAKFAISPRSMGQASR